MSRLRRRHVLAFSVIIMAQGLLAGGEESAGTVREKIVASAKKYIGTVYRYGGTGGSGFDCSGFVAKVYLEQGIKLPHSSSKQFLGGKKIDHAKAQAGDLVFFAINGKKVSHVGIYAGNAKFIHAPRTGKKVMLSDMENRYWKKRYAGTISYLE